VGPPISFSCLPLALGDRDPQTLRVMTGVPIHRQWGAGGKNALAVEWPSARQKHGSGTSDAYASLVVL
jgi:hypothetical protein